MFCTQCGAQNPDDNSFCTRCGARIAAAPAANQNQHPSQGAAADPGQTTQIASSPAGSQPTPNATPFAAPQQPVQQQTSTQPDFSQQQDPRYTAPVSHAGSIPQASQTPAPQASETQQSTPAQQAASPYHPSAQPVAQSVHEVMGASQPMPRAAANVAQTPASTSGKKKAGKGDKKKLVVPIVAVLIVLLGIGIAAFITDGFGLIKVSPKSSINEYSWGELSKISNEISNAKTDSEALDVAKEYNLVGKDGKLDGTQKKDVTLSNGQKTSVMITGFNHDDKTKGGKAGISFMFTDAIYSAGMNSSDTNAGGWEKSQMRSWLASEGIKMLPEDMQKAIVEVDKKTNNTGQTTNTSAVTTTSDKLWLYSLVEIGGPVDWNAKKDSAYDNILNTEGSQYVVFKNLNIVPDQSNDSLIRDLNGSPCYWWTRSPYLLDTRSFWTGSKRGHIQSHGKATFSGGVVPGFCL